MNKSTCDSFTIWGFWKSVLEIWEIGRHSLEFIEIPGFS